MMKKILKVGLAILGLSSAISASMTQEEQTVLNYARSAYSNPDAGLPEILQGFDVIWTGEKMLASREGNGSRKVIIEDLPGGLPSVARVSSTSSVNGVQQRGSTVFEIILHPQPVLESAATATSNLLPGEDRGVALLKLLRAKSVAAPGAESSQAANKIGSFVLNGAPDELINHYMARRLAFDLVERRDLSLEKVLDIFTRDGLSSSLINIFKINVENARIEIERAIAQLPE